MANTENGPRYAHDCNRCKFLGRFEEFDLYHCEGLAAGSTVLARWSNDGADYQSGMNSSLPALVEAQRRVGRLGLPGSISYSQQVHYDEYKKDPGHGALGDCEDCRIVAGTADRSKDAERMLALAVEAQNAYWDALAALEAKLGIEINLDGDSLDGYTVERLLGKFGMVGLDRVAEACECGRPPHECATFEDPEAEYGDLE